MSSEFSILGRGRAGRALAAAWGPRVALFPHTARPEGLVVLAVPDRAVAELAETFPGRCVHLAGSLHLASVPCAHPLTSFDGEPRDWNGTPLAITGAVPDALRRAFGDLGFAAFDLPAELKPLYHAAAVLTSGHAATLWLGAEALLRTQGVALPGRGLLPLAEATLHNVERHGAKGRTGPFSRQDAATIQRDAAALPEPWREIFLKLGVRLIELSTMPSTFKPPLALRLETPSAWAAAALVDPEALLSDHAHCEKKAALSALALARSFGEASRASGLLIRLAEEEMDHFRRVLDALQGFGWTLQPDRGNAYAQGLHRLAAKGLLDRLLIAALIEARSCERLWLLERAAAGHPVLGSAPWLAFLLELERCEAGHALSYRGLAEERFGAQARTRLDWWLDREAEVIQGLPWRSTVH